MTTDEPVRLELYVRSLLAEQARSQQEEIIERLGDLENDGAIDEFQIVVWGQQAPASPAQARTEAGEFVLNRVAVFSQWGEANGFDVADQFEYRDVESSMVDESYQAVRFPVMTLAEYHGQDLVFVAPAGDGGSVHTVRDRIDVIETTTDADERGETTDHLDQAYAEPPRELTMAAPDEAEPSGL